MAVMFGCVNVDGFWLDFTADEGVEEDGALVVGVNVEPREAGLLVVFQMPGHE